jgi:hypothetical protein
LGISLQYLEIYTKMKHYKSFNFNPVIIIIGILLLMFTIFLTIKIQTKPHNLIPLSVFALLGGLFFEAKLLFEKWSTLLWVTLGSFAFSLISFLPGKGEYNLDAQIQIWPYTFLFIFVIITMVDNKEKTIAKLSEGITLLQSIAVIYWVIDLHLYETHNVFVKILMIVGLIFSVITLFNAFTDLALSRTNRLILSIWSSIIMIVFGADNIIRTYQLGPIETTSNIMDAIFIGIQFFLLGISSVYIAQNLYLLFGFLPGRDEFFNNAYFKTLKELKNDHITRFSKAQASVTYSISCFALTVITFYVNYHFQILPRNMAIMIVFLVYPYLLNFLDSVFQHNESEL